MVSSKVGNGRVLYNSWEYLRREVFDKQANRNLRRNRGFTSKTFLRLNYLPLNHSKDNAEIEVSTKYETHHQYSSSA